jgi:hypothetical protein
MPTPEEKYRMYSATAQKASTSKGIVSSILGKLKADGNLE